VTRDLRAEWILRTLSEKKDANMLGKDLESMVDGSCDLGLRCNLADCRLCLTRFSLARPISTPQ